MSWKKSMKQHSARKPRKIRATQSILCQEAITADVLCTMARGTFKTQ